MAQVGYLLVKLDVLVARLHFQSEVHELRSEPREGAGNKGDAGEASGGQHERLVLAHILDILDVRRRFHVVGAFALPSLRLLD